MIVPSNPAPAAFESDVPATETTKNEQDHVGPTAETIASVKSKKDGGIGGFGGSF